MPGALRGQQPNPCGESSTAVRRHAREGARRGPSTEMSDALQERALKAVYERHDRCVMNNIQRGDYVECLVAELLGPDMGPALEDRV